MTSSDNDPGLARRGFLERLATAALPVAILSVGMRRPAAAQRAPASSMPSRGMAFAVPPDETWLRNLVGAHRTVFDVEAHRNGHALVQAKGFLDAYERAYGVPRREVNLVLGVRGTGLPLVLGDALWARYRIGEQYGITSPSTAPSGTAAATHNVFTSPHVQPDGPVTTEQTLDALQRRGVLFLVCMNTIDGAARKLAALNLGSANTIRVDLLAGLLPGVVPVPAMLVAFDRMQARGISYVYAG